MRKSTILSFLICSLFMVGSISSVFAAGMGNSPMAQMAGIMHDLNHYPDANGKKKLQMIMDDSSVSANQRTLAGAMMHLEHKVASGDVDKLKAIIASGDATQQEKDLAQIILNLNHSPSSADKKKLEMMMK